MHVALLQHGLFDSSADAWVMNDIQKTLLLYLLREEGVDVWIGSSRGSEYSSNWELGFN